MRLCEIQSVKEISLDPGIKKSGLTKANVSDQRLDLLKSKGLLSAQQTFPADREFGVLVHQASQYQEVFLVERETDRVAVYLLLYKFGRFAHSVEEVKVRKNYQGRGLGIKLYRYLIKQQGITLISGKQQSPGAARLWSELYRTPGISVYGYNPGARDKKDRYFHVEPDEVGNIESLAGKDVYGVELSYLERTPRLIATAS